MLKVTVLGAGNGGISTAAHLTLKGHEVTLSNRRKKRLEPFLEDKKIYLKDGIFKDLVVEIIKVNNDIQESIKNADIIIICVPAVGHEFYAQKIANILSEDQIVLLNPGQTGGAIHFANILKKSGFLGIPKVCETNTLTYACRLVDEKTVTIYSIASNVLISVFPARESEKIISKVLKLYSTLKPVNTVLETSFANLNAVLHPPSMLLNAGTIERTKGDFYFYYEGTTPAVGKLMDAIDRERCCIMEKIGLKPVTFLKLFYDSGYTTKEALKNKSCYKALKESRPNRWIKSPATLKHRYLDEDVGFGLVPMAQIGALFGVNTPVMNSLICLASEINTINYWQEGLNLEKLGLKNIILGNLQKLVREGKY